MKFIYFVVLLAWSPDGMPTKDSGVIGATTLELCHNRTLKFAKKHGTVIELCQKISEKGYKIIAAQKVTFNWQLKPMEIITPKDPEVERLKAALREIGKWHVGKTRDSQRVRAIIKKAIE